jgi:hypothetical protein
MKLTAAAVRKLEIPPGELDKIFFDDEVAGFGMRVRKGGSRSYVVQYAIGKKQRRMSLGKVELQGVDKGKRRN